MINTKTEYSGIRFFNKIKREMGENPIQPPLL